MSKQYLAIIVVVCLALLFLLWKFVIEPLSLWIMSHALISAVLITILIALFTLLLYYVGWYLPRKTKEENASLKETLKSFGYSEYSNRHAEVKWGNIQQISQWEKEDTEEYEYETHCNEILQNIKAFTPTKIYEKEEQYHYELQGYLRTKYPHSKVEHSIEDARPDIVIDYVAIEVKGPTTNGDLDTLPEKCSKYTKHWKKVIFVLFEPKYNNSTYLNLTEALIKIYGTKIKFVAMKKGGIA